MNPLTCNCGGPSGFEPCEPAPGLPAQRCADCRGLLLSLAEYRPWRDQHFSELAAVDPAPLPGRETPSIVRKCPCCGRLMERYRTGNAESFWLDFCPKCELVWFDVDEWERLEEAGLTPYLDTILTERWQKRIQSQRESAFRAELLRERFGDATFAEIERIQGWLAQQPNRRDIVAYLFASVAGKHA